MRNDAFWLTTKNSPTAPRLPVHTNFGVAVDRCGVKKKFSLADDDFVAPTTASARPPVGFTPLENEKACGVLVLSQPSPAVRSGNALKSEVAPVGFDEKNCLREENLKSREWRQRQKKIENNFPVDDIKAAPDHNGGDHGLPGQLCAIFSVGISRELEPLPAAVSSRAPNEIQLAAHKLEGSVTATNDMQAMDASLQPESAALCGDREGVNETFESIRQIFCTLQDCACELKIETASDAKRGKGSAKKH